jgi:dTMP kinase
MAVLKNKSRGKFIVFEGLDGSGQTTQALKLRDFLLAKKLKVYLTKEPTDSLIGGLIRSQLRQYWKSNQECLQLLFAADRSFHLEKEILPFLEKGINVISDRYFFSSLAYGAFEIQDKEWLWQINRQFLLPDLTIFLKVPPKICLARIKNNRFERTLFEKENILKKVLKNYLDFKDRFQNFFIVEGDKSPELVFEEIKKILNKTFPDLF